MGAKLVIRVRPNDLVEVKVEGLTQQDTAKKPEQKLCRKITKRLEEDLGLVERRDYDGPAELSVENPLEDELQLGGS